MSLRRKPATAGPDITSRRDPRPASQDRRIDELIDKGGTVAVDAPPQDGGQRGSLPLRLDAGLIARIDRARGRRRPVAPSRLSWILEALIEKLLREEKSR